MKVLMLGWEFPPHISGGLGTACYGLTKALIKEKIEVLFVVPRLFGDEADADFLINASNVMKPARPHTRRSVTIPRKQSAAMTTQIRESKTLGDQEQITYVEVASSLSPYQGSGQKKFQKRTGGITAWNYSMRQGHRAYMEKTTLQTVDAPEEWPSGKTYQFSGSYGENLMEEVRRYADVAEIVADKHTFDVIHVHDWMTFLAGVAVKKRTGKPLVVHVHSTEFDRSGLPVNREVFEIERLGFTHADKIVAVSRWTKDTIVSRYRIPAEKITVVHNGILPKKKGESFTFPEIASHFITFLGRVTHQKGPWFFVEAAHMVLKEFPNAHFIVAGAGDLLPQIIERVAALNMSASFHFTGFLSGDQVDRIWSLTDVYVMPSVSEPFGIAPLEAIQGDVPVILSKQSGVAEVMPHAIKVDFWDVKALAAAICSVLRYESLSNVLRQKSKQHIKRLTWDKAAREVKVLYHELTAH